MDEPKTNRFTKYFPLLLDALRSADPTPMRPAEACAWIRAKIDVAAEDLTRHIVNGRQSIFENDVHWTRFYLAKAGLVSKPKRGLWGLTPEGRDTRLTPEETWALYVRIRDANRPNLSNDEDDVPAPETADAEEEDETSYWFVGAVWNGTDDQMRGLALARRIGFRIKLNAVAVKNLVEPDIVPLARYARENDFEPRYIEFMPLDAQNLWDRGKVLLAGDIMALLSREISPLSPVPDPDPRAPASEYVYEDGGGTVGFIAPVSRPFCLNCNRLRLTADGKLRYCLFAIEEDDVKTLMRSGAGDEEIATLVRRNVAGKWAGHEINSAKFVAPPRPMYSIGG
jgi:hypothetical protein